jgi:KDO2-lipid IV(A) lauroyltransferase
MSFWRLGLWLVRIVPKPLLVALAHLGAGVYWHLGGKRREVVIQNILPAMQNDRAAAAQQARRLFYQFALKLIDLWRYEAGLPVHDLLGEATGLDHFFNAQAQKRGVLLLTPHVGNWELGGPWLTRHGIKLHVVTLAEPGERFTELRQASRARWNIETLVIGNDPFASVEIVRRLEAGATVALVVDRPPAGSAMMVELFGQPFPASVAAAELARASGCLLLPVYIPRHGRTYKAHVLPLIPYDRAALRDRAARQELTQQMMRVFEPVIREHPDQWYHFVPVWPASKSE